ncbi:2-hydroxy-3-oxopropionate reductase [Cellulomonas pakistanensis]|uniref:2-hydroxy-3-oxopropionate reductase n=1 Tax=Cellulomonas pakistanensis TaxID=992287 RepID=A0A919PBF1_9CELL|nr:2-hydroxy-3-oxopropionate reductase [Cellulomonas pakistanensis]GIG35542.1 2-hydroxy-3-oxopropionate reductase [Cellulomonas pakistanensis]
MRIGFIGLGIMGRPMALNLLRAGHDLVVSSGSHAADELAGAGATLADGPRAIAEQVELVITMLPNGPEVQQVALGDDGVAAGAHDGLVLVDMSSIAPTAARAVHDGLAAVGVPMLDAPVSGGEPKAVDGTLSIMVGGDEAVFDRVRDVLGVLGASVVRVGPIGAGSTAKLANQVVVAANIAAVSEALVLAELAGVDPEAVVAAIRGGLAGSAVLESKGPMMLRRDFAPGFRIELHAKDLRNARETGEVLSAPLPLTTAVLAMMEQLEQDGHGGDDHSGLVQHYEDRAGTRIGAER